MSNVIAKERPILFSAPMVRAILEGRKTQTRRAVKPQPYIDDMGNFCWNGSNFGQDGNGPHIQAIASPLPSSKTKRIHCPFGKPGDTLWVRETFFAFGRWETRFSAKKGRDEWHFVDMTSECDRAYQYAADNPDVPLAHGRGSLPGWYRRPAIHMPRTASRTALDVTAVRVERLQDISAQDAIAEGIARSGEGWERFHCDPDAPEGQAFTRNPALAYRGVWEQINGPDSWAANPWVWVIEFRRAA